eukprot:m.19586 g.19586  ORF g.19586 m.19586 type:complete len:294 (-) comp6620_c0_seq1:107-988(-)
MALPIRYCCTRLALVTVLAVLFMPLFQQPNTQTYTEFSTKTPSSSPAVQRTSFASMGVTAQIAPAVQQQIDAESKNNIAHFLQPLAVTIRPFQREGGKEIKEKLVKQYNEEMANKPPTLSPNEQRQHDKLMEAIGEHKEWVKKQQRPTCAKNLGEMYGIHCVCHKGYKCSGSLCNTGTVDNGLKLSGFVQSHCLDCVCAPSGEEASNIAVENPPRKIDSVASNIAIDILSPVDVLLQRVGLEKYAAGFKEQGLDFVSDMTDAADVVLEAAYERINLSASEKLKISEELNKMKS